MNKLDNEIIKLKEQIDLTQEFGDARKVESYNQKIKGFELGIRLVGRLKQRDFCCHSELIINKDKTIVECIECGSASKIMIGNNTN